MLPNWGMASVLTYIPVAEITRERDASFWVSGTGCFQNPASHHLPGYHPRSFLVISPWLSQWASCSCPCTPFSLPPYSPNCHCSLKTVSQLMSLLCQAPAAPSLIQSKSQSLPSGPQDPSWSGFCPFSDLLSISSPAHLLRFSALAACHVSNVLNTPCSLHTGGFFCLEALPLHIHVVSPCVHAHGPLQLGLSCSQPTLLPSTLQYIFLNVTCNHMTHYTFYFILFVCPKCQLHEDGVPLEPKR